MKKNENVLYDERYKFYQALTENEAFRKRIVAYRVSLSLMGYSFPKGGFVDRSASQQWVDNLHRDYHYRRDNDERYLREQRKITKGKTQMSMEESDAIDELLLKMLPPYPYHTKLTDIIKEFITFRDIDDYDFNFVTNFFLFDKIVYSPSILTTKTIRNKDNEVELWVRIHPWTRKNDIVKYWPSIKWMQSTLDGYKPRFRKSKELDEMLDNASSDAIRTAKSRKNKRLRRDR